MRTILKVGLLFTSLSLLSGCKAYNCGCPMSSQPAAKNISAHHQSVR
ncbi:MAG: hypothetical protein RIC19_14535 [Phaeodactylibacter sp.]